MNKYLAGTLAGLAATAPMSVVMLAWHKRLPRREKYPLPPRQITMKLASMVGVKHKLDEPQRKAVTWAGHFGYGAGCGAIYGAVSDKLPGHPALKGAAFGLLVWLASYLGWIPAANVLPPATEHPARRNALMIVAHLVWGAATGMLTEQFLAADGTQINADENEE